MRCESVRCGAWQYRIEHGMHMYFPKYYDNNIPKSDHNSADPSAIMQQQFVKLLTVKFHPLVSKRLLLHLLLITVIHSLALLGCKDHILSRLLLAQ